MTEVKKYIKDLEYNVIFKISCKSCNTTKIIKVKFEDYIKYVNGYTVNESFSYLIEEEKHILINDECISCYNEKIYGQNLFNLKEVV